MGDHSIHCTDDANDIIGCYTNVGIFDCFGAMSACDASGGYILRIKTPTEKDAVAGKYTNLTKYLFLTWFNCEKDNYSHPLLCVGSWWRHQMETFSA